MRFWYWLGYTLSKIVARLFFRYRVIHAERIPKDGPMILAMNHQSFLDPPLAGIACDRAIFFLARKTLLGVPVLGWLLPRINVVPVDRDGADMSALKTIIRLIKSGQGTILFPEGTRTQDGALQKAQPGLGLVIAKTLAPVVPMRIFGAFEAFPRTEKLPRRHPITIVVGEPMVFSREELAAGGKEMYRELSERVMAQIAALELPKA